MAPSVSLHFGLAVAGGVAANLALLRMSTLHAGCANVLTLCQFLYGVGETMVSPNKRRLIYERRLGMQWHLLFATMFWLGPWLGNLGLSLTEADFHPVFLVVRSCGVVCSMILGAGFAGNRYTARQVVCVFVVSAGACITTVGCWLSSHDHGDGRDGPRTSGGMFAVGLGLLVLNLLNDAGLSVVQGWVFRERGRAVDECVVMMSLIGSGLMLLSTGSQAWSLIGIWVRRPSSYVTVLGLPLPTELSLLVLNFMGNFNAKRTIVWLNANASAVVSSFVPMLYRLLATVIVQLQSSGLPAFSWFGVSLVSLGSTVYLTSPSVPVVPKRDMHKQHKQ